MGAAWQRGWPCSSVRPRLQTRRPPLSSTRVTRTGSRSESRSWRPGRRRGRRPRRVCPRRGRESARPPSRDERPADVQAVPVLTNRRLEPPAGDGSITADQLDGTRAAPEPDVDVVVHPPSRTGPQLRPGKSIPTISKVTASPSGSPPRRERASTPTPHAARPAERGSPRPRRTPPRRRPVASHGTGPAQSDRHGLRGRVRAVREQATNARRSPVPGGRPPRMPAPDRIDPSTATPAVTSSSMASSR